jgi:hypothetical protein
MSKSHSALERHSRSAVLLRQIIVAGWFDVSRLAAELVVDERTIGLYMCGSLPMPIERRLCFAQFLIEHVPALSRHGHNLLSQLRAEVQFAQSTTRVHKGQPMTLFKN